MTSLTLVRFSVDPDIESTFTATSDHSTAASLYRPASVTCFEATSSLALNQLTRSHLEINVHPLSVTASSDIAFGNHPVLSSKTQFDDGLSTATDYSEQRNGE